MRTSKTVPVPPIRRLYWGALVADRLDSAPRSPVSVPFAQLVMLAQLGAYRIGHGLAAMDLSRLAAEYRGMPTRAAVAVTC